MFLYCSSCCLGAGLTMKLLNPVQTSVLPGRLWTRTWIFRPIIKSRVPDQVILWSAAGQNRSEDQSPGHSLRKCIEDKDPNALNESRLRGGAKGQRKVHGSCSVAVEGMHAGRQTSDGWMDETSQTTSPTMFIVDFSHQDLNLFTD